MEIICLGLNHTTSNIAIRECLSFTPMKLNAALARLGCGEDPQWKDILELVILSTCNRVELYAVAKTPIFDTLTSYLSKVKGLPDDAFGENCYRFVGEEAIEHLYRVSAGLNSVVIGEPQILGQVTDAYTTARRHNTAGPILSRLFQAAIYAGKKARTETRISHNPASISSVAIELIVNIIPEFTNAKVLVLGAGEMAELAVESLRKRGVTDLVVVNRTAKKARELAEKWGARAFSLEALGDVLPEMDVLITSTGAPHLIIMRDLLEAVMQKRPERQLVIMDIAVPRDVDQTAKGLPNLSLYDLDDLSTRLDVSLEARAAEIPMVEKILDEETIKFFQFLDTLDILPVIKQIRSQANSIREKELQKTIRRIPNLSADMEKRLDLLTRSIVQKILHHPTVRLREIAGEEVSGEYASIARGLFGLD